jgi:hypothetical protein
MSRVRRLPPCRARSRFRVVCMHGNSSVVSSLRTTSLLKCCRGRWRGHTRRVWQAGMAAVRVSSGQSPRYQIRSADVHQRAFAALPSHKYAGTAVGAPDPRSTWAAQAAQDLVRVFPTLSQPPCRNLRSETDPDSRRPPSSRRTRPHCTVPRTRIVAGLSSWSAVLAPSSAVKYAADVGRSRCEAPDGRRRFPSHQRDCDPPRSSCSNSPDPAGMPHDPHVMHDSDVGGLARYVSS